VRAVKEHCLAATAGRLGNHLGTTVSSPDQHTQRATSIGYTVYNYITHGVTAPCVGQSGTGLVSKVVK